MLPLNSSFWVRLNKVCLLAARAHTAPERVYAALLAAGPAPCDCLPLTPVPSTAAGPQHSAGRQCRHRSREPCQEGLAPGPGGGQLSLPLPSQCSAPRDHTATLALPRIALRLFVCPSARLLPQHVTRHASPRLGQVTARALQYKRWPPEQLPVAPDAQFHPGLPVAGTTPLGPVVVTV